MATAQADPTAFEQGAGQSVHQWPWQVVKADPGLSRVSGGTGDDAGDKTGKAATYIQGPSRR